MFVGRKQIEKATAFISFFFFLLVCLFVCFCLLLLVWFSLMLYNYGMIFFISIIFRWLYFIIQFGWALNYSSLLVQGIVHGCSFTLVRKGYDNHPCHNKPPDRCPWCNGCRRRNWTRRHEFKSWTRLIAFHIALIPLGKVWIQLFSLQLWVNSRAD